MIGAVEQIWPTTKIQLCITHLQVNIRENCKKIFGEQGWNDSCLKEILILWVGCCYLPIMENGLDDMIKTRIQDIIRGIPDMLNCETKIEKMKIYLAKYFNTGGQYQMQRWNYSSYCLSDEPFIGSSNGCEVNV